MCVYSVKEMQVNENNRTRMQCQVPFELPKNVEVAWRFAEEVTGEHTLLAFKKDRLIFFKRSVLSFSLTYGKKQRKMLNGCRTGSVRTSALSLPLQTTRCKLGR